MNNHSHKNTIDIARKSILTGVLCALVAATSLISVEASANPFKPPSLGPHIDPQSGLPVGKNFKPGPLAPPSLPNKPNGPVIGGCAGTKLGCNPIDNGGWVAGAAVGLIGLSLAAAQQASADDDGCYYIVKRVYVEDYGMVRKRFQVCD